VGKGVMVLGLGEEGLRIPEVGMELECGVGRWWEFSTGERKSVDVDSIYSHPSQTARRIGHPRGCGVLRND
jgi:hypothetical protein